MIKPIVKSTVELRKSCLEVVKEDDYLSIITDLKETLASVQGLGLAANQIGYNKRIAYICASIPEPLEFVMINPVIVRKDVKARCPNERCLSFPGIKVDTARWMELEVEYYNEDFELEHVLFRGVSAIFVGHEIDHLNGLTMFDRKWRAR